VPECAFAGTVADKAIFVLKLDIVAHDFDARQPWGAV